jgi:hypothetical protein
MIPSVLCEFLIFLFLISETSLQMFNNMAETMFGFLPVNVAYFIGRFSHLLLVGK